MSRLLLVLLYLTPMLTITGCGGGVAEVPPPDKAPEMSPEEKQHMEDEMKKMRDMYKKK